MFLRSPLGLMKSGKTAQLKVCCLDLEPKFHLVRAPLNFTREMRHFQGLLVVDQGVGDNNDDTEPLF